MGSITWNPHLPYAALICVASTIVSGGISSPTRVFTHSVLFELYTIYIYIYNVLLYQ